MTPNWLFDRITSLIGVYILAVCLQVIASFLNWINDRVFGD